MALLKKLNTTPPGGWQYVQPETKLKLIGDSLDALVDNVRKHRTHRGIPIPEGAGLTREVQRQLCERLTTNDCFPEGDKDTWVPRDNEPFRTLHDMLAFSKVALAFISSGGQLEEFEEAKRRAAVCVDCPLNSVPTGCKCGIFYKAINAVVPKERQFEGLQVCMVCSCATAPKVNLPAKVIVAGEKGSKHRFPVNCWVPELLEVDKQQPTP